MKKFASLLLLIVFALPVLTACHTMQGAGQDIQAGGEQIESAAD